MRKILIVANVAKEHICKFHIPLIKLLKENGWSVDVACRIDEPIPECDNAFDLPCDRDPFRGGIVKSIKILKEIINVGNYEVLLCNTIVGSIIARLAAASFRKKGLKVFYLNHGLHFYPGASMSRWLMGYPIEKYLASKTDTLITINSVDYKTAKKYLKVDNIEKCHGMGVNLNRFREKNLSDSERVELRNSIGLSSDDFVMSYVAEIIENKNQGMLLDCLELIKVSIPNAKLILIGPEHDGGRLRKLIDDKNLQNRVILLGWRNDIPELLNISDVYVASSKSEGMGLNIIEAMACNLPVIASENRGHCEIIDNQRNGFIVKQNDSKNMADLVLQIHNDSIFKEVVTTQAQNDILKYETDMAMYELYQIILQNS